MITSDQLVYAARRIFEAAGRDYDFIDGARQHAGGAGADVLARHRCGRRLVIPFVLERGWHDPARVVDRLRAFADLWCICEVRVVADRDRGDEDGAA